MAHKTGEIITIQSGHYANFVGSHWWNLQQTSFCFDPNVSVDDNCLNHDIHFREGQTLQGEFTYTPRLILFDSKGSLGTLKKEGVLYDIPNQPVNIPWQENLSVMNEKKIEPNKFLKDLENGMEMDESDEKVAEGKEAHTHKPTISGDETLSNTHDEVCVSKKYFLDDSVHVWSDFLKVHYHPKTVCLIEGNHREDDENSADSIISGQIICKSQAVADEIEEKIHFFGEECDHLQSFQLFVDPYDRFAGIATNVLEAIADDYGSKSVLCYGLHPTTYHHESLMANRHRILSSLITYTTLHDHSSLLIPVSCSSNPWTETQSGMTLPYLDYKTDLNYHTSAIVAAMIDTASLPLRSKQDSLHVRDFCASLNYSSRKFANLIGALPLPLSHATPFLDYLMSSDGLPWQSFSSLGSKSVTSDPEVQLMVVRGVKGDLMKKSSHSDLPRMLSDCKTSADILNLFLLESLPKTRSNVRHFNPSLITTDPFPHIFNRSIDINGLVSDVKRNEHSRVDSVPALAGVQSHSAMGEHLKALVDEAKKINLKLMSGFVDQRYEVDDFNECVEKMLTILEDYPCHDESDSDSDNDDA